ncbi:hypothetical protein O181_039162 [Austropuccinia psidii MF-1]|uniref:ATP-dependent DNA helicase PIF1 n=1 Tax=Austropuccinia psidii MF-1 TaxID=1389203 RepID=A0A9Q3DCC3_9BASI|nr:hypothetical protein [Austropuccinia psidii MF-1]
MCDWPASDQKDCSPKDAPPEPFIFLRFPSCLGHVYLDNLIISTGIAIGEVFCQLSSNKQPDSSISLVEHGIDEVGPNWRNQATKYQGDPIVIIILAANSNQCVLSNRTRPGKAFFIGCWRLKSFVSSHPPSSITHPSILSSRWINASEILCFCNYPGAKHKSFQTESEATKWLDEFKEFKELYQSHHSNQHQHQNHSLKRNFEHVTKISPDQIDLHLKQPKRANLTQNQSPSSNSTKNVQSQSNFSNSNCNLTSSIDQKLSDSSSFIMIDDDDDPQFLDHDHHSISNSNVTDFQLPDFSPDQAQVFDAVCRGESVFFTGSAGTGKSFLLKFIIDYLRRKKHLNVQVTASTGIAASLIKGTTLHSFAGIGLGKEDVQRLIFKVKRSAKSRDRWTQVDVLVIDEVSMIDGNLFDKLNLVAQSIRSSNLPFGGIQLILAGDFFQLPPVSRRGVDAIRVPYVFECNYWKECIPKAMILQQVFRQSDPVFVSILNDLRYGIVTTQTEKVLKSLSRPVHYLDGIAPTELYPTKDDVESANKAHLNSINAPSIMFDAEDHVKVEQPRSNLIEQLNKNLLVGPQLVLKEGAQVMLVKNLPEYHLVNGSVGIVVGFGAQNDGFESLSDSSISKPFHSQRHPTFCMNVPTTKWPIVKFTDGQKLPIGPLSFEMEDASGVLLATRTQLPLILAWALSIHKSQGQTLDRVKINLAKSFEKGQVYVALSRATSLDRTQILGFNKAKVQAHPLVLEWTKEQTFFNSKEESFALLE